MVAFYGLTLPEWLGILGAAGSGLGAIASAWYAVTQAKREERAACEKRIARLRHADE
jgi:hypothetical protein